MLRGLKKSLILCVFLCVVTSVTQADYYKPTLFPIGLTGLNYTGEHMVENCPYSNVGYPNNDPPLWDWDDEKALIDALGVNCIGCEDAKPDYLIDLDPDGSNSNNYFHKVCNEDIDKNIIFKYTKPNL